MPNEDDHVVNFDEMSDEQKAQFVASLVEAYNQQLDELNFTRGALMSLAYGIDGAVLSIRERNIFSALNQLRNLKYYLVILRDYARGASGISPQEAREAEEFAEIVAGLGELEVPQGGDD